jgi:hypothetical protein
MDSAIKEAAINEIARTVDDLLLTRIHLYYTGYFVTKRLKDLEIKLRQASSALRFFDVEPIVPWVKEEAKWSMPNEEIWKFEKLKEYIDKHIEGDWFPTGFDSADSVNDYIDQRLKLSNITGIVEDQEYIADWTDKSVTIAEIALDLLSKAAGDGLKAAVIREHIETVLKRKIHEKSVGMTLYRLASSGDVSRSGHTWFIGDLAKNAKGEAGKKDEGSNAEASEPSE